MPAGSTYSTIATTTLGSAASNVTFSSISGSYTDLVIVYSTYSTANVADVLVQFNGDTASNYSVTILTGDGTSALSTRQSSQTQILADYYGSAGTTAGVFNSAIFNVMNYSNTTTNKTILARSGRAASGTDAIAGLWRSTAAITSILLKLGGSGNQFAIGSTFTLYGITAA